MGREATIFFMDNDPQNSSKFCLALDHAGYAVKRCPLDTLPNALNDTLQGVVVMSLGYDVAAGLQTLQQLNAEGQAWPVIFIANCEQIPEAVKAIKAGVLDFHVATDSPVDLLQSVQEAMLRLETENARRQHRDTIETRCAALSMRELEIMEYITSGETNLGIARKLGLSQRTIEVHRAHVMEKMQATSLADLTRMVDLCRRCCGEGN